MYTSPSTDVYRDIEMVPQDMYTDDRLSSPLNDNWFTSRGSAAVRVLYTGLRHNRKFCIFGPFLCISAGQIENNASL